MGQAKQRGTFEDRKQEAIERYSAKLIEYKGAGKKLYVGRDIPHKYVKAVRAHAATMNASSLAKAVAEATSKITIILP